MPIPENDALFAELALALKGKRPLPSSAEGRSPVALASALAKTTTSKGAGGEESVPVNVAPPASADEAIVRLIGRPSMLVENDRIVPPESAEWRRRLGIFRPLIDPLNRSVARVRVKNSERFEWLGTAWMLTKNVAITNRHVAGEFSFNTNDKPVFDTNAKGEKLEVTLDFGHALEASQKQYKVARVLYLAPDGGKNADMALLEIDGDNLPPPIELGDEPELDDWLGVIGYPAYDSRNARAAQLQIFGDVYEVKRFAPGKIIEGGQQGVVTHDASTLGGNSGSVVVNLHTGKAVGLHFAGRYLESNYAVNAATIRAVCEKLGIDLPVTAEPELPAFTGDESIAEAKADKTHPADYFKARKGYSASFLGSQHVVEWPDLGKKGTDVAPLKVAGAIDPNRLDYTHFSVTMSKSRRMPMVVGVNIHGKESVSIGREGDAWFFDGRLDRMYQIGNDEAYTNNKLDRGHMVRREDPNWGDDAEQANFDTFHYTNSAPQHSKLNQRTWLELEKFVLDKARALDHKASVFTGPVLRRNDFKYREIRVPAEFFKVVVVVDRETKELEATGYLQSQTDYLGDDLDEAVYDGGSTYQVPISDIEKITGLKFGLSQYDPMESAELEEGLDGFRGRRIRSADDIRVRR